MTAVLAGTPSTITWWAAAHALADGRAVEIDTRPGDGGRDEALRAETRTREEADVTHPTAQALAVTVRFDDDSRCLHFATDQGPVVVRVDAQDVLEAFGDAITEEAAEWYEQEDE